MSRNQRQLQLLVVDDDDDFRGTLVKRFTHSGFAIDDAAAPDEALSLAQRKEFDVAIFDLRMPGMDGLELLEIFKQEHGDCEIVVLTGQGTIDTAVTAMKLGAYDYLTKPFPLKELESVIERAYERRQLRKENRQLKTLLKRSQPAHDMIGQSEAMKDVFRLIERAGPSEKSILIQGESGTGKELVARALHQHSQRYEKPLVVINCAALPETLLESELFGHEKGAFTGAVNTKSGLFEVADGGTLFIDEIGEMPGSLQAKLLRVLEDGSLRRVGSVKERRVNVRVLAATNRRLQDEVSEGRFREDLYYRINVMALELPPIRKRSGDIRLLTTHFLGHGWDIAPDAMQAMERYEWPGNVRQLANAIERAKIMADSQLVQLCDLPQEVREQVPMGTNGAQVDTDDLSKLERAKIIEVMRRESGNKTRAARKLGIDRRKLYRLVDKYSIHQTEYAS